MERAAPSHEPSEGLAPWEDPGIRYLVLGSFPSRASLELGAYYAHPRNHFWPILEAVFGASPGYGAAERKSFALERGIGIWDVLGSCRRPGSLDGDIREAAPNDLEAFIDAHPRLERILLNGSYSLKTFTRKVHVEYLAGRGIKAIGLPSTSPVPSRRYRRFGDKLGPWREALIASWL
jgi:TDG/mug DNA glycosylase family protein